MYNFYNRFWPGHSPEVYALMLTVALLSMNLNTVVLFSLFALEINLEGFVYFEIGVFLLLVLIGFKYIIFNEIYLKWLDDSEGSKSYNVIKKFGFIFYMFASIGLLILINNIIRNS